MKNIKGLTLLVAVFGAILSTVKDGASATAYELSSPPPQSLTVVDRSSWGCTDGETNYGLKNFQFEVRAWEGVATSNADGQVPNPTNAEGYITAPVPNAKVFFWNGGAKSEYFYTGTDGRITVRAHYCVLTVPSTPECFYSACVWTAPSTVAQPRASLASGVGQYRSSGSPSLVDYSTPRANHLRQAPISMYSVAGVPGPATVEPQAFTFSTTNVATATDYFAGLYVTWPQSNALILTPTEDGRAIGGTCNPAVYGGATGSGSVQIVRWAGNAPVANRSAFVLFEGIDPNEEYWPHHGFALLMGVNTKIRRYDHSNPPPYTHGSDIWIVNYANGGADIRYCLVPDAIAALNAIKDYYVSTFGSTRPMVVAGFSMGGVVARAALTQLDSTHSLLSTGVVKYLSIDAPHQGAYLHPGVQAAIWQPLDWPSCNWTAENTEDMKRSFLKIRSPAAKQLLTDVCDQPSSCNGITGYGIGICASRSQTVHDNFAYWLRNQQSSYLYLSGYPQIPRYAIALADPNVGNYNLGSGALLHGQDQLGTIHTWPETILETPLVSWSLYGPPVPGYDGLMARPEGSLIDLVSSNTSKATFYYDPTFIKINSSLDNNVGYKSGGIESPLGKSSTDFDMIGGKDSPFHRVWVPRNGQYWHHDLKTIVAFADAAGSRHLRIGCGPEFPRCQDAEKTPSYNSAVCTADPGFCFDLGTSMTLKEFLSEATDPKITY